MLDSKLGPRATLALDTILGKSTQGIPCWMIHVMEHSLIERLAGAEPGTYRRDPERVYIAAQRAAGVCMIDQYIPDNPLTMGDHGYAGATPGATTGARQIVRDGMVIDSPEAVVEHMERFLLPEIRRQIAGFDQAAAVAEMIATETAIQAKLAPDILKAGCGAVAFPKLWYYSYGYANYFSAYVLYPEIMERHFRLQADLAVLQNRAAARAFREGSFPPQYRLDHDMADSRGLLVSPASLDEMWLPHFARALDPLLAAGVKLMWHCDGNLMALVPRLIEAGVSGFQGFQYEDGMDYESICQMTSRDGEPLLIIAGVSSTTTLPHGTPADVRRQMKWLVESGPPSGLFLGCSSSVTPGAPWENIRALVDGVAHFRRHGRHGL